MTVTGRVVDSEEALRIGLVNTVVAHEDLVPTAVDRAAVIAAADSAAVRAAIALYRRGDGATLEEALNYESEAADAWRTDSTRSLERMSTITGKQEKPA